MRTALPKQVELIPGPGCPVCVCPEEDVYEAIRLALHEDVLLVAFGDMLRVPVNVAKGEPRSLEQARAAGGDVQPIASPLEAVAIAQRHPRRQVVFFAAGFETTSAPVAAMMAAGVPDNLSILLSGRRTWPAVAMLLDSGEARFDALIAPGHVATVMGPEEWSFVVDRHAMPAAIAGFNPESLLAAIYSVLRQTIEGRPFSGQLLSRAGAPRRQSHGTAPTRSRVSSDKRQLAGYWSDSGFGLWYQPRSGRVGCPFAIPVAAGFASACR